MNNAIIPSQKTVGATFFKFALLRESPARQIVFGVKKEKENVPADIHPVHSLFIWAIYMAFDSVSGREGCLFGRTCSSSCAGDFFRTSTYLI